MEISVCRLALAAAPTLVLAAGIESRAGTVYTYTTLVEITSPIPVGPDVAVGEAFGHLTEGVGNGTLQMEGHNSPTGSRWRRVPGQRAGRRRRPARFVCEPRPRDRSRRIVADRPIAPWLRSTLFPRGWRTAESDPTPVPQGDGASTGSRACN
jgi:hypothetical protein